MWHMKFFTLALAVWMTTAGTAFAGNGLLSEIGDLRNLFDSGLGFNSDTTIPNPFSRGNWGTAPKIESSRAKQNAASFRDALNTEACHFVDAVNVRQPSLAESLTALGTCLSALSQKYGTTITATEGDSKEIVLVISGIIPAGSTIVADLRRSLELREGQLFGHPARVLRLRRAPRESKRSSLQFIVDRCPTIKMIRPIRSAKEFLDIYGSCIKTAKGLEIMAILTHPTDAHGIVVYSKDRKDTISEMNGIISVPSDNGLVKIQVNAFQEVLSSSLLPAVYSPGS